MDDMNCLSARRIISTDVTDKSAAFVQHISSCESCKAFYERQLKFNSVLKKAIDIDVPDGLAARVLVEHKLNSKKESKQKFQWGAIAASMMLDFRCLVVPRFVYAPEACFEDGRIADSEILKRVHQLTAELLRIGGALSSPSEPKQAENSNA